MNERIKELAEQCETTYIDRDGRRYAEFDKEKFAELIVRECVETLMKPEYAMTHPDEFGDYNRGWVNGRLLGIEHIKERFGFEK